MTEKEIILLPETTRNPISLIGERAGVCYNADITDKEKNYKRGLNCIKSNHGRLLEFVNIEMIISGYSARVIREWYTHIGGAPTRLQESTRYVNEENFDLVTIPSIEQSSATKEAYKAFKKDVQTLYKCFLEAGVPKEDAAMILPLGMTTKIIDKRNLRNLIDMSRNRLCTRAYWEYRQLMLDIILALRARSEEWNTLCDIVFMPKCKAVGYCTEDKGCGLYPQKDKE